MALTESTRVEKRTRIRTIAALMSTRDYLTVILSNDMGDFSEEETAILNDAADMLEHFVRLASAQT